MPHALGLDFGTSSVRALLWNLTDGSVAALGEAAYAHGEHGVIVDARDPELARQHPLDHLQGTEAAVQALWQQLPGLDRAQIAGIGVDATGSTPVPVAADGRALGEVDPAAEPAALAWLWKDHTATAAAQQIVAAVQRAGLPYLEPTGGAYSPEWFWAKLLHCARANPQTFARAASFVELHDFVPAWLCGQRAPGRVARGICAAGHKGLFAAAWGGWPSAEFLGALHPGLAALRATLPPRCGRAGDVAGHLDPQIAARLGLPAGIAVGVGALDAHAGAIGAGIAPGDLVKVLGTSSCDMAVGPAGERAVGVPGIAGVVPDSILPGMIGYEAGQAAVGDLFAWCARQFGGGSLERLTADAARLQPGESGLLALDWHNGCRSLLMDAELSGMIVGLSLHSTPAAIYRAMLEACAFGSRQIVERLQQARVPVRRVLCCGGIAQKSPLFLQILADVLGCEIAVADHPQASALGAAIIGAVAGGALSDFAAARALLQPPRRNFRPSGAARLVYDELFGLYRQLHDAFGRAGPVDLQPVMKRMLALRARCRSR